MTTPKVSVIIPVYNAESTIVKCIESVLLQDYSNIECVIINDGSTDNTEKIILSKYSHNSCIKYLKTENHGVSHARNTGLDIATGDYIVFLDSDDYLLEESISSRVQRMNQNSLVICGYCEDSVDNAYLFDEATFKDDIPVFLLNLFYMKPYGYQGYSVNKIYSTKIIRENKIRFNEEISYNEDRLFVFEYTLNCSHVYYVNKNLYCYVQTAGSAMHSVKHKIYNHKQITELKSFVEMFTLAPTKRILNSIYYACFSSCCRILDRMPRGNEYKSDRKTVIKLRNECFWRYFCFAWRFSELIYKCKLIVKMILSVLGVKRKNA